MLHLLKEQVRCVPPGSMLCKVWKTYARQRRPGMTKQTSNQNLRRGYGGASLTIFVTHSCLNCFKQ